MVNVAYLNKYVNESEENYSMLIHTSGKQADHSIDYKQVIKTLEVLKIRNANHEAYFRKIWDIARERYPDQAKDLTNTCFQALNETTL